MKMLKKLAVVAALVVCSAAVAQATADLGTAQVNVPSSGGTITYLVEEGGAYVDVYVGNGQPPVWRGTAAEFRAAMRRGAGLAEAFMP